MGLEKPHGFDLMATCAVAQIGNFWKQGLPSLLFFEKYITQPDKVLNEVLKHYEYIVNTTVTSSSSDNYSTNSQISNLGLVYYQISSQASFNDE